MWLRAAGVDSDTRAWDLTIADTFSTEWASVDGTEVTITAADLNKGLMVAVESVQGTFDAETNPWQRSAAQAVGAKPTSGS